MNHKEMHNIYAPWESQLLEKLKEADWILSRVDLAAEALGIHESQRKQFIANKVVQLIDEIAEERENTRKGDDMRKKYFAAGGQIREQKQEKPKKGRAKGETYKGYVPPKQQVGPDLLMASLDVPLPTEQSNKIVELYEYGWLRSDIAKELGLPKTRVNHEIFKRKGGGAA